MSTAPAAVDSAAAVSLAACCSCQRLPCAWVAASQARQRASAYCLSRLFLAATRASDLLVCACTCSR